MNVVKNVHISRASAARGVEYKQRRVTLILYQKYPSFMAPQTGLEPVTPRLTAACSANWAIEAYSDNKYYPVVRWIMSFVLFSWAINKKCRRRLIFPGGCPPSIFSAEELNYRVRDGNGWTLFAIDTDSIWNTVFSVFLPFWWPVADSNRCCRRERPES